MTTGMVTNIQRYSVNDGYGIRTIVFMAGCTMRCFWCQNPETLGTGAAAVMFSASSCTGCGACLEVCPSGAVHRTDRGPAFDRSRCRACFACVRECYFGARKASATRMEVDAALAEVLKDEAFYRSSGGGLTVSGGEPLLQAEFTLELLRKTRAAGIHTAVETAGNAPRAAVAAVIPCTDLFLFDVKALDHELHQKVTGVSNRTILANLALVADSGVETIIRVPLIPGVNDGREFDAIANYVAAWRNFRELHILPYHSVGASKYDQLGLAYPAGDTPEDNEAEIQRCAGYAGSLGLRVSVGGFGFAVPEAAAARA